MKTKKPTTFKAFRKEADEYVKEVYGSSLADLMVDDSDVQNAFDNGDTPKEYIDWMGEKYGFTKKKDFTLAMAKRVMGSLGK